MSSTIQHPSLGSIRGKSEAGVVRFSGLKYATLKDRFAAPVLAEGASDGEVDATKYGPTVISPPAGIDVEFAFVQQMLPKPDYPGMSDVDGLTLNITVPQDASQDKLPVLVWIHGGGFALGANWWPQYDFGRFVKLAQREGTPFIAVGISYRLGIPGFLTSEELRKAGYPGNNGLRDQRTALEWVKKYIAGFGGDPDNVTLMGESAGGVSTLLALHSPNPLCKRAISLAGTPLLLKPLPPPVTEIAYSSVIKALDLDALSAEDRIQALLKVPAEDLLTKVPQSVPIMPFLDHDMIPASTNFSSLATGADIAGFKWCDDLFIGSCALDGNILGYLGLEPRRKDIASAFCTSITKTLTSLGHADVAEELFKEYKLTPSTPDAEAWLAVLKIASDINFMAPAVAYAKAWPGKAYLYYFNEPNPWEGPYKGESTHILDVAYLFQNYAEKLDEKQRNVAEAFAKDVIAFINGKAPWKAFGESNGARVYGPSGESAAVKFVQDGEDTGRKGALFRLAEKAGLDALSEAWGNFFRGE